MAKKNKITNIVNKVEVIHFVCNIQNDYSLCGHDLAGDSWLGWEEGEPTKDKVTCVECIRIVKYCKAIRNSEMIDIGQE